MKFTMNALLLALGLLPYAQVHATALRGDLHSSRGLIEQDSCTALLADTQYESDSPENNEGDLMLACEFDNGMIYEMKLESLSQGDLNTFIQENNIISGTTIVKGVKGKIPVLSSILEFAEDEALIFENPSADDRRLAVTTGQRSVLAVLVTASDGGGQVSNTFGASKLSDEVFGTSGDAVNLCSQYEECSNGKFLLGPTGFSGVSDGVTSVSVSLSTTSHSTRSQRIAYENAVTEELNRIFNVNSPSQIANHVMYCFPDASGSSWIAYAYLNSWNSVYRDTWCLSLSAQMHEVGHNLNLGHSGETAIYDDQQGMMGFSYSSQDAPRMCFNGAKYAQLGWLDEGTGIVTHFVDDLSKTFAIEGVAKESWENGNPEVVRVTDSSWSDEYFINFNWRSGFNSQTQEAANQVTITRRPKSPDRAESDLVAKLSTGGSYTINESSDIPVTVNSINTSTGTAFVTVGRLTAAPTMAPIVQAPNPAPVQPPSPAPVPAPSPSPPSCFLFIFC